MQYKHLLYAYVQEINFNSPNNIDGNKVKENGATLFTKRCQYLSWMSISSSLYKNTLSRVVDSGKTKTVKRCGKLPLAPNVPSICLAAVGEVHIQEMVRSRRKKLKSKYLIIIIGIIIIFNGSSSGSGSGSGNGDSSRKNDSDGDGSGSGGVGGSGRGGGGSGSGSGSGSGGDSVSVSGGGGGGGGGSGRGGSGSGGGSGGSGRCFNKSKDC